VDCNDGNAAVNPGVLVETCNNGIDDNCNALVDEGCPVCGALELCGINGLGNGVDDDCNGMIDDGCVGLQSGTFVFTGPATYGNTSTPYAGGDIYVWGYSPTHMISWGVLCDPAMDTNASLTDFTCNVSFPSGSEIIGQVSMAVAGGPDGFIHYGDMSDTGYGGNGVTLGSLSVNIGGPVAVTMVTAPSYSPPILDTWNFRVLVP
jgi:hypothetical protein